MGGRLGRALSRGSGASGVGVGDAGMGPGRVNPCDSCSLRRRAASMERSIACSIGLTRSTADLDWSMMIALSLAFVSIDRRGDEVASRARFEAPFDPHRPHNRNRLVKFRRARAPERAAVRRSAWDASKSSADAATAVRSAQTGFRVWARTAAERYPRPGAAADESAAEREGASVGPEGRTERSN